MMSVEALTTMRRVTLEEEEEAGSATMHRPVCPP